MIYLDFFILCNYTLPTSLKYDHPQFPVESMSFERLSF
jgi:hypothetical protein